MKTFCVLMILVVLCALVQHEASAIQFTVKYVARTYRRVSDARRICKRETGLDYAKLAFIGQVQEYQAVHEGCAYTNAGAITFSDDGSYAPCRNPTGMYCHGAIPRSG